MREVGLLKLLNIHLNLCCQSQQWIFESPLSPPPERSIWPLPVVLVHNSRSLRAFSLTSVKDLCCTNILYIYIYIYIHTLTHLQWRIKIPTKSQRFLTVLFRFLFHFILLTAWWLLFCKKLHETQGSLSIFHGIEYINLIYLFIIIIIYIHIYMQ